MNGVLWRWLYLAGWGVFTGNAFVGEQAGNYLITNGDGGNTNNTFIGTNAGYTTSTGGANTFVGTSAVFTIPPVIKILF
jgi:hypothetical protein